MKGIFKLQVFLIALIIIQYSALLSQVKSVNSSFGDDEILIVIPIDQLMIAQKNLLSGLKFYYRFSDRVLVGTNKSCLHSLQKARIDVKTIDENPWTQSYAVVRAVSPYAEMRKYVARRVNSIYHDESFDIVKGDELAFNKLRKQGLLCVKIYSEEIPHNLFSTYLPEHAMGATNSWIDSVLAFVSDSTITSYIQGMQDFGTRIYLNANRDSVYNWVKARYEDLGITDVKLDSFYYSSTWQKNVVASIPGNHNPSFEVVVGGHLDSYSSDPSHAPGADDNATGTVAALEMARVLQLIHYQPSMTLRFMGFAAEEAGLVGSHDYAVKAKQAGRKIKLMMNYDMIGNRNQSQRDREFNIIHPTFSNAYAQLYAAMAIRYTTLKPLTNTNQGGSDDLSFSAQGYNSVWCFEVDFSPHYHSPGDLLQYLDIPYARDIIKAGVATLLTLDQLPQTITNLNILDRGDGSSLYISWDNLKPADFYQYKVYLGLSPNNYYTSFLTTQNNVIVNQLTMGMRYYIGISTIDLAGQEGVIVEVNCKPDSVPVSPVGLTAQNIENGIRLHWLKNLEMDFAGYNIYRAIAPETTFTRINIQPFRDTVWVDSVLSQGTYSYYITAVDSSGYQSQHSDTVTGSPVLDVEENTSKIPSAFKLHQNYPNPFNPRTAIRFDLPVESHVKLTVYDLLGAKVTTLLDEKRGAGSYKIEFDALELASGLYIYQLQAFNSWKQFGQSFQETKKLLIMK